MKSKVLEKNLANKHFSSAQSVKREGEVKIIEPREWMLRTNCKHMIQVMLQHTANNCIVKHPK